MQGMSEITDMGAEIGVSIWRLRAANPSPMTGQGTNTYVIKGPETALVIDPGPALPAHLDAILAVAGPLPLAGILVTHAHLDHTELVPELKRRTRAEVLAYGPVAEGRSALMQSLVAAGLTSGGEGLDHSFNPDRRLHDGQILDLAGLRLDVLHTPGHLAGHLCFALGQTLFTGDHVMGWSTSLVSPPDGDMAAYVASLTRLATRPWQRFLPGHGGEVTSPDARLQELRQHRQARESAILQALTAGPATPDALAQAIYTDTPPHLLPAASRNILAHLIDLQARNRVTCRLPLTAKAAFSLL
jgi:glyoxylase-like metal-dependent hydrolase (beta-lactamase superfamily II)